MPIETGDTVKHIPTGETWIVACVEGNDLSWCGWPEGMARLSDCELVEKATVQRRQELLESLAAMGQDDHRARYAKRLLNAPACKTCGGHGVLVDGSGLFQGGGPKDVPCPDCAKES